ncbi:uncharacterized protein Gasu_39560 [Galdieria sulphuraria]|uniref:Uncharacterized protein n=1 Tax=Galdieria sulphuraria TaxID=130081 RepID=M2XYM5_GALSU|nr:uncharacterized protein Gasu_39560 [Galdieria sulphuraria]EME28579.1 hypothetical protein Gasu_39560 [Galdieria sulphuraria]|eukprot:XP_005705099.1 hypothetical protein Gasu_39560 [Galdieria sulphuraria]
MWCFLLDCPLYSLPTKARALCHRCDGKFQRSILSGKNRVFQRSTRESQSGCGTLFLFSKLKFDQSTVVYWLKKTVQFFQSENGQFILFGLVCYLVLSGKISWIFDSFLIFFSVISIIPIIGLLVFRWWVTQNVVQVFCPNCSSPVVGIKGREVPCSNCGYLLTVDDQVIIAKDSSNRKDGNKKKQSTISVIDVDAREVGDE